MRTTPATCDECLLPRGDSANRECLTRELESIREGVGEGGGCRKMRE